MKNIVSVTYNKCLMLADHPCKDRAYVVSGSGNDNMKEPLMRILQGVSSPTPEQLKIIGDVKPGFRIIRGAAGSGKTTTALLCLRQLVAARLNRRQRHGHSSPVRVLVLTFNRTLEGYITELARKSTPDDDALDLTISTFARWAKSLVGNVDIADHDQVSAMLRPLLGSFATSRQHDFFVDEVDYILGRFMTENRSDYLSARRHGRGISPRLDRPIRETVLYVVGGYFVGGALNDFGCLSCLGAGLVDRLLLGTVCCCFFCFWGAC